MTDTSSNSESGSEGQETEPLSTVPPEVQEASEDFSAARVKVKYSEQRSTSLQDPEPDFGDGADGDRLDGDGADGAGEDLEADVREHAPFGSSSYFEDVGDENWSLEWPLGMPMSGSQAESQLTQSLFESQLAQEEDGILEEVKEIGLDDELPPLSPLSPLSAIGDVDPVDVRISVEEEQVSPKYGSVQFALLPSRSQSLDPIGKTKSQLSDGMDQVTAELSTVMMSNSGSLPKNGDSLKTRFRQSRAVSKSLGTLDIRRTVASPMEGGIKQKTSARQTSSSARAFREVVPRADRARRMQQMHGSQHDDAPGQMDGSHQAVEAGSPRGLSLRQLRPVTTIRPPRSRPVPWVDRREHFGEVRTAQMDLDWDMEGHIPQVSEAAPGFLSAAHLRSEEYWRDLLGLDDEHQAPFHCVQSQACGKFIAACIVIFVLIVGHHDTHELPTWAFRMVHLILAVSFVEICMHLVNHYCGAPYKKPEDRPILILDTIAVFLSCAELWILPHLLGDILPFSRMIWLVRFLRVLSMIPSLRELTLGIMDALHGLFWVLIFLFIFVYALAVVLTRMVGHQKKSEDEDVQEVMDMFSNVGNSMFYLFQLTSQWSLVPLFPLLKASPFICVSFTLFYIYSGWVIVAVMTGTVSFTMISFKERMVQDDDSREEEKRHFVKLVLTDIFEQLDSNGDGELDYEEFKALLKSKEVLLLLSDHTDIKIQDLEDMWQWIDTDKSGSVTIPEFFEGFELLNEPFQQKTLLRVQERVSGEIHETIHTLEELVVESLDDCCHAIYTPMLKIHAVLEQVQIQLLTTTKLKQQVGLIPVLEETEEDIFVKQALASMGDLGLQKCTLTSLESRIEVQINEALERIHRFQVIRKPQGM